MVIVLLADIVRGCAGRGQGVARSRMFNEEGRKERKRREEREEKETREEETGLFGARLAREIIRGRRSEGADAGAYAERRRLFWKRSNRALVCRTPSRKVMQRIFRVFAKHPRAACAHEATPRRVDPLRLVAGKALMRPP